MGMVSAQSARVFELYGGYANPKGMNGGLQFGGSYGMAIDERVDLSFGLSYFGSRKVDKTVREEAEDGDGVEVDKVTQTTDYSNTLLPLTANVTIKFPMQLPLCWYVGAGVAYEFLIVKKTTFTGFGWTARAGVEYIIGSRSSLLFEATYNSCKPRANRDENDGVKTWDEVNVSGFGIHVGLRFEIY